jgi:hypothetical protein
MPRGLLSATQSRAHRVASANSCTVHTSRRSRRRTESLGGARRKARATDQRTAAHSACHLCTCVSWGRGTCPWPTWTMSLLAVAHPRRPCFPSTTHLCVYRVALVSSCTALTPRRSRCRAHTSSGACVRAPATGQCLALATCVTSSIPFVLLQPARIGNRPNQTLENPGSLETGEDP